MSHNLQSFTKGASLLRSVVNRVPADQWDSTSCCDGWSAREVAGHITWGLETVASFAQGGGMAGEMAEAERAGDDPAATVSAAVDSAIAALDHPGALQHDTPLGMSLDGFLQIMGVDSMTHAWDIADAAGIDSGIDELTAAAALEAMKPMEAMMRAPGRFGEAVDSTSKSAVDQFIAFAGRTSVR